MNDRKCFSLVIIVTFVINSFQLVNFNGLYWDDWVIYGHDFETIENMFFMAGGASYWLPTYMHAILLSLGVWSYRVALLILTLFTSASLYGILSKFKGLFPIDRFFIVLLFSVVPFFESNLYLINFPYTFCVAIFYCSFYFYASNEGGLSLPKRGLLLFAFFISFFVNSLISFYGLFLLYVLFTQFNKDETKWRSFINVLIYKSDFVFLPLVFIFIKFTYFAPSGLYENYNKLGFDSFEFFSFIRDLSIVLDRNFIELLISLFNESYVFWLGCVLAAFLFSYFIRSNYCYQHWFANYFFILIVGMLAFLLGSIPYVLVNKIPVMFGPNSRFQLLLPLSFALIVVSVVSILTVRLSLWVRNFILLFLIFALCIFKLDSMIKFNLDWFYQQSLVETFKQSEQIEEKSTFNYTTFSKNTVIRPLRFYAINGLSRAAFGNDTRLFVYKIGEKRIARISHFKEYKQYNFSSWTKDDIVNLSISKPKDYPIGNRRLDKVRYIFRMRALEVFNAEKFKLETRKLINLDIIEGY